MERFSIEVSPRKVPAGRDTKMPAAAGPCDLTNCACLEGPRGTAMRKADRNPTVRHPQDISPLSDD